MLLASVAIGALSTAPAAAEDQLTIVSWGGAYQESQREAFMKPYQKDTGAKITEEEYNGEIAKIRAMVEANAITWDVIDRHGPPLPVVPKASSAGRLGEARPRQSKFIGSDQFDCAVRTSVLDDHRLRRRQAEPRPDDDRRSVRSAEVPGQTGVAEEPLRESGMGPDRRWGADWRCLQGVEHA
jgi:hypothetical protein